MVEAIIGRMVICTSCLLGKWISSMLQDLSNTVILQKNRSNNEKYNPNKNNSNKTLAKKALSQNPLILHKNILIRRQSLKPEFHGIQTHIQSSKAHKLMNL